MSAQERLAALRALLLPYLPQLDSDVWTLRESEEGGPTTLATHCVPGVLLGGRVEYVPAHPKARHGEVSGRLYALLRGGHFAVLVASGTWDSRRWRSRFRERYEVRLAEEGAAAELPMHVAAGFVAQHLARAGAPPEAIAAAEALRHL